MREAIPGALLDAPVWGVGGLVFLGVDVTWWIAGLAILYGVARLVYVSIEFYWKWKDRKEYERDKAISKHDLDGDVARSVGGKSGTGPDPN